jgi:hypothetical protein
MKNESSKHFISLDRADYTCYLDEKEILLQAGLSAQVKKIGEIGTGEDKITLFDLYISEKNVSRHQVN